MIHVAVAVILDADGRILVSKRHADSHQGALWEFPGGKVEAGEEVFAALCRELKEELDIDVLGAEPFIEVTHHYDECSVLLNTWIVRDFTGEPVGAEGQPVQWVDLKTLELLPLPDANQAILSKLKSSISS